MRLFGHNDRQPKREEVMEIDKSRKFVWVGAGAAIVVLLAATAWRLLRPSAHDAAVKELTQLATGGLSEQEIDQASQEVPKNPEVLQAGAHSDAEKTQAAAREAQEKYQ